MSLWLGYKKINHCISASSSDCPAIIPRCMWEAQPYRGTPTLLSLPLSFLYIHHTYEPSQPCLSFQQCSQDMRSMQRFHQDDRGWDDIGYRCEQETLMFLHASFNFYQMYHLQWWPKVLKQKWNKCFNNFFNFRKYWLKKKVILCNLKKTSAVLWCHMFELFPEGLCTEIWHRKLAIHLRI